MGLPWWDGGQIRASRQDQSTLSPRWQDAARKQLCKPGRGSLPDPDSRDASTSDFQPPAWGETHVCCIGHPVHRTFVLAARTDRRGRGLQSGLREPVHARSRLLCSESSSGLTRDTRKVFGELRANSKVLSTAGIKKLLHDFNAEEHS